MTRTFVADDNLLPLREPWITEECATCQCTLIRTVGPERGGWTHVVNFEVRDAHHVPTPGPGR